MPFLIQGNARHALSEERTWQLGLLVDVGSTFTKVIVLKSREGFVASAKAHTTIDTDVLNGVAAAVDQLPGELGRSFDWALASSSAAGGLRMVSVGLTEALSGKAGTLAALGGGGKVVGTEFGFLDDAGLARVAEAKPHLVLLAGGIDGGNRTAMLHNAERLSRLEGAHGFVIAGNRDAAQDAAKILHAAGRDAAIVRNVYPDVGQIDIAEPRDAVRELFLRHITKAKGLDGLMTRLKTTCEPTPLAVSRALMCMGEVTGSPVVMVDLGGATTDVHSFGGTRETKRLAEVPDPEVMRTVEGDLGMRWSAPGIVETMGRHRIRSMNLMLGCDLEQEAAARHENPSFVPASQHDWAVDRFLAQLAVEKAIERHAGRVHLRHRPWGDRYEVHGKDLRDCRLVVSVGGVFTHAIAPRTITAKALEAIVDGHVPRDPEIRIDASYACFAIGLIAREAPETAASLVSDLFDLKSDKKSKEPLRHE